MKKFTILWPLAIMLACWFAFCEPGVAESSFVRFNIQATPSNYNQLSDIEVVPEGFMPEDIMQAFSFAPEDAIYLQTFDDGFIYESEFGQAISDSLYMVDHENLDELCEFDLSFMPIDEACEYAVNCFETLGISTKVEAAYAINKSEYDRLYNLHQEWIEDMGRSKMAWVADDVCYVIYLNQEYSGVKVYPSCFFREEITGNSPGTEIVVFVFASGIEYISCGWTTSQVDVFRPHDLLNYETAACIFAAEYNDVLTLAPRKITVNFAELTYMTFESEARYILKPFWRFCVSFEDGQCADYMVNAVNGEVFGL